MMKRKNSPQKNLQEITTANELIKKDLNNITEREFRIIVIKLIAGLENSIEDSRDSIATEIKGLRNSQEVLKNAINKLQNRGAWVAQSVKRPTSARSRSRGP